MGKILGYAINTIFIIVCFVHIVKVIYMSANPEFADTIIYGKQLKDIEFPIAFILCVSEENFSQKYKKHGYSDEEHFFAGQSGYNNLNYGWFGHFENGSTPQTFQGSLKNILKIYTYTKHLTSEILDEVDLNWSDVVREVFVEGPPGQERKVENITWSTLPLYPNCQTLDLLANPYFDGSKPSKEVTFILPINTGLNDFSIQIQERNKLLKKRRLKSSMLAYDGPQIIVGMNKSSSFQVSLKMSQFIYLETDTERDCRTYPNSDYDSYRDCDEDFISQELTRDFGLTPFWATDNLSEITKKK